MTAHAPYNFVPLAKWVYEPDWAPFVSQDIPFADGMCGELQIDIVAETPILVGGERVAKEVAWTAGNGPTRNGALAVVEPFKLGTRYAIPPATLQGALRNIIEIAAFGRFHRLQDTRFGLRDLADSAKTIYRDRIVNHSRYGWLHFDAERSVWVVTPCSMARVDFGTLSQIAQQRRYQWERRTDADQRYRAIGWENVPQDLVVGSDGWARLPGQRNNIDSATPGEIVISGNTGVRHRPKRGEFFFYNERPEDSLALETDRYREFVAIHDPDDGRPANPAWKMWEQRLKSGSAKRIPIFFITDKSDERRIASFGLAKMFKLAHEKSTYDLVENSSNAHLDRRRLDLATAIFGEAADDGEGWALKGRVAFGFAFLQGGGRPGGVLRTILMGPKPSFYPFYVSQPDDLRQGFASYTPVDRGSKEIREPTLAGWKRYPVHVSGVGTSDVQEQKDGNPEQHVGLRPLPENSRFVTMLRFHNLRPQELGALIWAITWGGDETLRHAIGMAKPYGLGQVAMTVTGINVIPNDMTCAPITLSSGNNGEEFSRKLSDWMRCFSDEMEGAAKNSPLGREGWAGSAQLRELKAMADPKKAGRRHVDLSYMRLEMQRSNEFAEIKKGNNKQRLLPYSMLVSRGG